MQTDSEISAKILECIIKATNRDDLGELGGDELFSSHDIDSLDQMSMIVEVEGAFDTEFDDVEPKELTCINDYVAVIKKTVGEG